MKRILLLAALLIASSAPALAQTVRNEYQNINLVETLEAAGNFKILLTGLHKTGLIKTLKAPGPFTILAPNDEAFANLPPGILDDLMRNPAKLRRLLLYHVAAGKFSINELQSRTDRSILMMENTKVEILCDGFSYPGAQPQSRNVETAFGQGNSAAKDDRLKPANSRSKAEIQCNGLNPASSQPKARILCDSAAPAGEQIVSAAIRQPDGTIVKGKNHPQILLDMGKPVPEDRSGPEYGFVTTTGRFVSREEAAKIAGVPNTIKEGSLYTQDLTAAQGKESSLQSKERLLCNDSPANSKSDAESKAKIQCNGLTPVSSQAKGKIQCNGLAPANSASRTRLQRNDISAAPTVINKTARVVMADLTASNGMIHVIDAVLMPGKQ